VLEVGPGSSTTASRCPAFQLSKALVTAEQTQSKESDWSHEGLVIGHLACRVAGSDI
jgi:hypothetical protein